MMRRSLLAVGALALVVVATVAANGSAVTGQGRFAILHAPPSAEAKYSRETELIMIDTANGQTWKYMEIRTERGITVPFWIVMERLTTREEIDGFLARQK